MNDYKCVDCAGVNDFIDGRDGYNCIIGADVEASACAQNFMYSFSQL